MGFRKRIESRKAVTTDYWRILSFSFGQSGNLTIKVAGYKDGTAFSNGADPIDELEVVFHNADTHIKTLFYDLIENNVPLFKGAEKDLTHSVGQQSAAQVLTVQTPRGDLIERITLEPLPGDIPAAEPVPMPPEPETSHAPELVETLPGEMPEPDPWPIVTENPINTDPV